MYFVLPSLDLVTEALEAAANATVKIVFLVVIGVIATANGVFNDQGVSDLGRLVYHVTLPSLLFVNILREVSVARLLVLWKLPAMAVLHVTSGYVLALVLIHIFKLRGIESKAVTLAMMFGNVGALSIAVIDTLCDDEPLHSGVGPMCAVRGVEYISFYLITQNILMFTWAEEIVKNHDDEEMEDEDEEEATVVPQLGQSPSADFALVKSGISSKGEGGSPTRPPFITTANVSSPGPSGSNLLSQNKAVTRYGGNEIGPDVPLKKQGAEHVIPRRDSMEGMPSRPPSGRLRRYYSQPSALDQQTINHILSRYPVESRPSIQTENQANVNGSIMGSMMMSVESFPSLLSPRVYRPAPTPSTTAADEGDRLIDPNSLTAQLGPPRSCPVCVEIILGCLRAFCQLIGRMAANPSIRAAMVAFALGLIPPIKALFVGGDKAPLGALLGAFEILGTAQVPCSMLMLSGSGTIRYLNARAAKTGVQSFAFSPKSIISIIVGRVFIFPFIGLLWWWAGFEAGFFVNVPVLSLVVLLDAAVPTAQNIVMLILVHGKPEHGHALAYVLLWQYAISVPVLIFCVTVFLAIIQQAYPT